METQTKQSRAAVAGESRGIDVARLEKELAAVWRRTAGGAEGEAPAEADVVRVCVANLIVYVPRGEERAALDALLEEVTAQTPCRAIILLADRSAAEARLEAYVSMRCQLAGRGAKQVCGEQVTIEAAGAAVEALASAVEPLLVPDIPVFLWWKDIPHYEDKLFGRLVGVSDRVVIDSASFDHPHEDLLRVAELIREHERLALSDLNWGRLTTWRNLLAGFWDVADYRPHLDRVDDVEIEYARPAGKTDEMPAQALLVAGWLASRLGWQLISVGPARAGDGRVFRLQARGREIRLELRAAEGLEERCGIVVRRVKLSRAGGAAEFYARMSRDWTKLETSAKIGDAHTVGRLLVYEARTEGQRLSREMTLLARDRVYEEAVGVATALIASPNAG